MKITNRTPWRTDSLREIVRRVAEQELEPHERKMLHVVFAMQYKPVSKPVAPRFSVDDVRYQAWKIKLRYHVIVEMPANGRLPIHLAWLVAWKLLQTQLNWQSRKDFKQYRSYEPYLWAQQYPLVLKPKKKKPVGREL